MYQKIKKDIKSSVITTKTDQISNKEINKPTDDGNIKFNVNNKDINKQPFLQVSNEKQNNKFTNESNTNK